MTREQLPKTIISPISGKILFLDPDIFEDEDNITYHSVYQEWYVEDENPGQADHQAWSNGLVVRYTDIDNVESIYIEVEPYKPN